MTAKSTFVDPAIQGFIIENVVRENPLLRELREETARMPNARMQIGPDQGEFMALLARDRFACASSEAGPSLREARARVDSRGPRSG